MGQNNPKQEFSSENYDIVSNACTTTTPFPPMKSQPQEPCQSKYSLRRRFKKFLKFFTFTCHHRNRHKLSKHVKLKENKGNPLTSFLPETGSGTIITPSAPNDFQLHWLRSSKHSILSYALSKLAFFSKLSKEKLKEDDKSNDQILKFCRDNKKNIKKSLRKISIADLENDSELRNKFIDKVLSQHSPSTSKTVHGGNLRKVGSPQEIYRRNLKRFETLVALTISSSSSSTSCESIDFLNAKTAPAAATIITTDAPPDENNNTIVELDLNQNPVEKVEKKQSSTGSLLTSLELPPRRIVTTSKNRVEVDVYFLDWVKKKIGISADSPPPATTTTVMATTVSPVTSSTDTATTKSKMSEDKNNNQPEKKGTFKFLKKGEGRRASVGGRGGSKSRSRSRGKKKSDDSNSTARTNTTTTASTKSENDKKCEKCGPCAGKGALSGAPPAYLDYGEAGAANAAGEAWKGKRKGDPVMDRLKNVDVVEEMTYLVPNPDCCGGGNGDGCEEVEEEDCEYYAVCESCGEMEPLPEELKEELVKKRKQKKAKVDSTPVTYSRRQRFNFKNKGDMCDEEEGPPYPYEGLTCPGKGCRCGCCTAGLRRDPECVCKCCQLMGPARKCNSFDEIPVGKNPQIRRILCPEEECAKIREHCHSLMPETPGMYKFDVENQVFERQVPRTPTPIIIEVEAPQPLTKQQLLALGREVQEKNRLGIGVDAYCPPHEENPMYLPPIYGQQNPPQQCPPQPCCVPNYCCGQDPNEKDKPASGAYSYGYDHDSKYYTGSEYTKSYTDYSAETKTTKTFTERTGVTSLRTDENNNYTDDNNTGIVTTDKKTSSSESLPNLYL